ncbi:MAG TPA: DUF3108 domain-containing protein [Kofleriaceae bacterium]|jgi:hypothetical protein|nr:DUF3108 domain-containing protein [Kofleriaceae bacterium]
MRCAALLVLAGCAGAGAGADGMALLPTSAARPAIVAGEVGLNPGESMAFEVRIAGLLVGEAQLAVGGLGDYEGHRAVVVKSRAASASVGAFVRHIVDEATTVVDMDTGRPLSLETLVEQGNIKTTARARFTGNVADITYVRSGDRAPHRFKIDLGKVIVHDAHSAMAQLRGWHATPGTTRSVFVVGGRRPWRVDVTYVGEDTIGSVIGNRRAVHFTGESYRTKNDLTTETEKPSRTFSVWLSDDADRVPLKVTARTELGDIVMDLTEYSR